MFYIYNKKDCRDKNCAINQKIINSMRLVWEQHVWWTRSLIISINSNLGDKDKVTKRLLQNPGDLANIFSEYYGVNAGNKIKDLFTEHLVIGGQLLQASKDNNAQEITRLNSMWYKNADAIAKTMVSINPYYNEEEVRKMMYTHLDLTKKEASMRFAGIYAADIMTFDEVEREALMMADYFSAGIINFLIKY